jgi:hypothetical protein
MGRILQFRKTHPTGPSEGGKREYYSVQRSILGSGQRELGLWRFVMIPLTMPANNLRYALYLKHWIWPSRGISTIPLELIAVGHTQRDWNQIFLEKVRDWLPLVDHLHPPLLSGVPGVSH